MQRQGTCNRCGQCCGAAGSSEQDSPWPDNWPDGLRNWLQETIETSFPILKLIGNPHFGGAESGVFNVRGKKCYWIWVKGHGLCKDLPPYGDLSTYSEECPFLLPDPGDGTRPCVLVGTQYRAVWDVMCQNQPPMEKTSEEVAVWQARHPLCSYTWN